MKIIYLFIVFVATIFLKPLQAKEVTLTSREFQKEFLQKISETMKTTALEYLNNYLREIETPKNAQDKFDSMLKLAMESNRLEPKIVFIKQYLDMVERKDTSRENMYGLRNVNFIKKLKNKMLQLQEDSFEEIHQLRYYFLCKQFKVQKKSNQPAYHNYYSNSTVLAPLAEQNQYNNSLSSNNNNSSSTSKWDEQPIFINVTEFGIELYNRVNEAGSDVINDYLIIIRKLLQEVLEPQSEEEATRHSEALRKILIEIEALLKIDDFYTKRQRLYDYLQNHLAVDYEQLQSSEASQHDLMEVFSRLKEKGLDLVVAFLFSNFEFIDYTQDQWRSLLPARASLTQYDERSRPLRKIQQLYEEFKQDFENSPKYDAYLEAVRLLHEQAKRDNADSTHIYEMIYSASQNVGSSRAALTFFKCNEM